MARKYWIEIEGTGIDIPNDDRDKRIHGFVVTRVVRADTSLEASEAALKSVCEEWTTGMLAGHKAVPKLRVTRITPAAWWRSIAAALVPYVFIE